MDQRLTGSWTLAQRIENARQSFVDNVSEQFDLTPADAEKALNYMIKVKVLKIDPVMGQYNIIHGAYWDKEVMRRAVIAYNKTAKH